MASWVAPCSGVHIKRQFVNSPPLSLLGLPRTALANQYENGTILSFLSTGYQGVGAHCCWTRHHLDKCTPWQQKWSASVPYGRDHDERFCQRS
jgi:hypothetical protein